MKPTLIVICGWPLSGKTTLAKEVSRCMGNIHHIDIDELRAIVTGMPRPHPDMSEEMTMRDMQEMGMAYRVMMKAAEENIIAGRSVIVTATFSRKIGQSMLLGLARRNTESALKVVQCMPVNDTEDMVAGMIGIRDFGENGYRGAVNSAERYFEVKEHFCPLEIQHRKVPTWGSPNTVEQSAQLAIDYALS